MKVFFRFHEIARGRGRPRRVPVQPEPLEDQNDWPAQEPQPATANAPDMSELVARLQHQLKEQQRIIERLNARQDNRIEERVNKPALQEVAAPAARREPLLILWKKARLADFDGSGDPLTAQGWFKTTENMMEGMELSDNEKVRCASYSLTMDARIWWETV